MLKISYALLGEKNVPAMHRIKLLAGVTTPEIGDVKCILRLCTMQIVFFSKREEFNMTNRLHLMNR